MTASPGEPVVRDGSRQLAFILITVDDELNAYTVFETLNARGLELDGFAEELPLLPGPRGRRPGCSPASLAATHRHCRTGAFSEVSSVPLVVRTAQGAESAAVQDGARPNQTAADVFALLDQGEPSRAVCGGLGSHGYWTDLPGARPYIRELNLFHVQQMMPLLFAVWERFPDADFVRVLKLVSVISFR